MPRRPKPERQPSPCKMIDEAPVSRVATCPLPLRLIKSVDPGAQAQGFAIARSELARAAPRLEPRARRYPNLRLTLGNSEAVFWSTQAVDLPWLSVPVTYLQPPANRIFMPVGWTHNVSEQMFQELLNSLVSGSEPGTPIVLLPLSPDRDSSELKIIKLESSLSVATVDWARLSRGST